MKPGAAPADVGALADQGMALVRKASLAGLTAYLRAEAVLFTHGLYGSPRPPPRSRSSTSGTATAPKTSGPTSRWAAHIASTYLVGSTQLFSGYQAAAFDVPPDHVLVTGNARTDQFWQPLDRRRLRELGITGDFVVWMPTFRRPRAVGAVRVRDDVGAVTEGGSSELRALIDGLRERGIQLVVKPHPMDADRRELDDVVTVDEEDLVRAGVSLYGLLGASSGLVTDYSSTWVDYLLLDRPIAFLVPDRTSYDRALLPADVLDWVPGEVVACRDRPFQRFLQDLDSRGRDGAAERHDVAERIGLRASRTAAEDLVATLAARGVLTSR